MLNRRILRLETERLYTLFAVLLGITAWLFREMERRQALRERDDKERREYEDQKLSELSEAALGHRERSAMVRSGIGLLATAATIIVGVGVLYQIGAFG